MKSNALDMWEAHTLTEEHFDKLLDKYIEALLFRNSNTSILHDGTLFKIFRSHCAKKIRFNNTSVSGIRPESMVVSHNKHNDIQFILDNYEKFDFESGFKLHSNPSEL